MFGSHPNLQGTVNNSPRETALIWEPHLQLTKTILPFSLPWWNLSGSSCGWSPVHLPPQNWKKNPYIYNQKPTKNFFFPIHLWIREDSPQRSEPDRMRNEKSELYMWWNSRSSEKEKEKKTQQQQQQQQHRLWKNFVCDNRDNLLVRWTLWSAASNPLLMILCCS